MPGIYTLNIQFRAETASGFEVTNKGIDTSLKT